MIEHIYVKMDKKAQLSQIFDSRRIVFIFGGAVLGYMISTTIQGTIIGAIIGGIIGFLK